MRLSIWWKRAARSPLIGCGFSTKSAATKRCSSRTRARRSRSCAERVRRRLEGVVIARSYSLLEYNIPTAKLADAEKMTPGFNSPTVNRLEDPAWCSVRAMVKRGEVISHYGAARSTRRPCHSRNANQKLSVVAVSRDAVAERVDGKGIMGMKKMDRG